MKTFEQKFIDQLIAIGKYEIEIYDKVDGEVVWVWDKEDETSTTYKFDNNGNLVDIY